MSDNNFKARLKHHRLRLFHFGVVFFLLSLNISTSFFVRSQELFFVVNPYPLGLRFSNFYLLVLLVIVMTMVFTRLKLFTKYPIYTALIISGSWSNILEYVYFGNVADYIDLWIAYFNLADTQIWSGLLLINIQIWIFESEFWQSKKISESKKINN